MMEARWVIALLSDTGLRLSEALGLAKDDVNLTATTPYIDIRPRPRRRLKTRSSKRQVARRRTSVLGAAAGL